MEEEPITTPTIGSLWLDLAHDPRDPRHPCPAIPIVGQRVHAVDTDAVLEWGGHEWLEVTGD